MSPLMCRGIVKLTVSTEVATKCELVGCFSDKCIYPLVCLQTRAQAIFQIAFIRTEIK